MRMELDVTTEEGKWKKEAKEKVTSMRSELPAVWVFNDPLLLGTQRMFGVIFIEA